MPTVFGHVNLVARDWRLLSRFYQDVFPQVLDLRLVEEGRMGVEAGHHAADGVLHELVLAHRVNVLAADALHDLGEQPRVLPGQRRAGRVALGEHAPAHGEGETEPRADQEGEERGLRDSWVGTGAGTRSPWYLRGWRWVGAPA